MILTFPFVLIFRIGINTDKINVVFIYETFLKQEQLCQTFR